ARRTLAASAARGTRGPGRRVPALQPGRARALLPDLDDLLRVAGAAPPAGDRRRVGTAAEVAGLRLRAAVIRAEARRAVRDGDDREAGRLGRPGQHHTGRADGRRRAR